MENTLWNKDKNYRITVYICSIMIVCALIFTRYYSYQSKKRIERRQTEISMKQTIAEALIEKKEAVQKEKEFYAERRKRIETGTAKIEVINETDMHGFKYQYTLIDGKKEGVAYGWYSNKTVIMWMKMVMLINSKVHSSLWMAKRKASMMCGLRRI